MSLPIAIAIALSTPCEALLPVCEQQTDLAIDYARRALSERDAFRAELSSCRTRLYARQQHELPEAITPAPDPGLPGWVLVVVGAAVGLSAGLLVGAHIGDLP